MRDSLLQPESAEQTDRKLYKLGKKPDMITQWLLCTVFDSMALKTWVLQQQPDGQGTLMCVVAMSCQSVALVSAVVLMCATL